VIRDNKTMPMILLVDNGSIRAEATRQLRLLADKLSHLSGKKIYPVSLQHADKINKYQLDDEQADILITFIGDYLAQGRRQFIVLPLFFGQSKAVSTGIIAYLESIQKKYTDVVFQVADVVYPLPQGEPLLADIIYDHIRITRQQFDVAVESIVLVDHGSPLPRVTAVRQHLAKSVQQKLSKGEYLKQAVMERREGKAYLFNGELLQDWLIKKAKSGEKSAIVSLLFFLAGRHAGKKGDIDAICNQVMSTYPDFKIAITPLVSEHKLLLSLLLRRLQGAEQQMARCIKNQKANSVDQYLRDSI
jgi:sirohydrochlorin ferrochelatase